MTTTVKTRGIVLCGLFSALIAIGAFLQVPVPFMDYFTLQFLFVTLAGMLLGSRRGSLAVAVYVAVGLAGIPVFAAASSTSSARALATCSGSSPPRGSPDGFASGPARDGSGSFCPPPSRGWRSPMRSASSINF